nr:hypothetical protein [Tanacetum cinerariifolium]
MIPYHTNNIQQSPTTAQPTHASPSLAQLYSPVQQPSPVAQHTPVQLQLSPTAVSHQTTIVLDHHAPTIVQNLLVNPNPDSVHPMVTHFHVGTNLSTKRLNLHMSLVSPLSKSYRDAFNDPKWQNAMRDEYTVYLADGTLSRYKARLVANVSTQLEGVDVDETFSLVVKLGTIRTVLSLVASRHWPIHQLDVKNAFLHVDLSKTVYMHQPPRFRDYVHPNYINRSLHQEFAMTDLGPLNYFLGISVTRDSSGLFLSQKKYAVEFLDTSHMVNCNSSQTPIDTESKLGSDGDMVCLYMHDPQEPHFFALKGILRYVRGTLDYGLQLFSSPTIDLVAYSDADWAGCPTTRRLTSGAEAEYHGVVNAIAETSWLCNLLRELHTPLSSATLVYCDNVRVLHVPSHYLYAAIFTKGLPSALFEEFRSSLSVQCPLAPTAGEC